MKNRFYQIIAIGALCLSAAAPAVVLWTSVLAQEEAPQSALAIPTTLNYQGHLRDPDGSLTTGTYDITAKIYDDPVCAEPECELYSTTLPGVNVRDGLFNIVLGDEPDPFEPSVFADAPLYIGISLDSNPELIPRQRLHAVPWAFQASTLITNAPAQTIQGLTSNGDVTVNGSLDSDSLNVAGGGLIVDSGGIMITQSGGTPSKPVQIHRFLDLGNNANIDTEIAAADWDCVAAGWSTRYTIDPTEVGNNMVWTYVNSTTNTWWAHVEFNNIDGGNGEDPDVDIVCFHKSIVNWNGASRYIDDPD